MPPYHAVDLSALVALGRTPRATETQPKLIPAQCAQVCWVTHQKPRSAQKFKTHLRARHAPPGRRAWVAHHVPPVSRRARTTTKARWDLHERRRCSSEQREWRKHRTQEALGPECTHPCFSTKQSCPCFGHLAPVVVSRSRTSGTTKLMNPSIKQLP